MTKLHADKVKKRSRLNFMVNLKDGFCSAVLLKSTALD